MMTNQQKAEKYDALVAEGHNVQHEISRVKSDIVSNDSVENNRKLNELQRKLVFLEQETNRLMFS